MKNRHLTDLERLEIEHALRQRTSLKKIAVKLDKHHSTLAREILSRRIASDKGALGRITNRCIRRADCDRRQLCMDKPDTSGGVHPVRNATASVQTSRRMFARSSHKLPMFCNGCKDESRYVLVQTRSGANITEDELLGLDALISPLIKKGQSIHHVLANNPDRFNLHQKTIYRYVAGGLLAIKNGDMPPICCSSLGRASRSSTRLTPDAALDKRMKTIRHSSPAHRNGTPSRWTPSSGAGAARSC